MPRGVRNKLIYKQLKKNCKGKSAKAINKLKYVDGEHFLKKCIAICWYNFRITDIVTGVSMDSSGQDAINVANNNFTSWKATTSKRISVD